MSQEVLAAQQWLNATYGNKSGYIRVDETGTPGTATSFALVSALQIELGITSPTGTFGPATTTASNASPLGVGSPYTNRVKILQHGLWCKGYNPGLVDGSFGQMTLTQLQLIQQQAGLTGNQVSSVAAGTQMKAVLGVDEYVLVDGGDTVVRQIQQALNQRYVDIIGLNPTDGIYSRATVTAMIMAIQAEQNSPSGYVDGIFGSTTQSHLPNIPYSNGQTDFNGSYYSSSSIGRLTYIAQWALYCLGRNENGTGSIYDPRVSGQDFTGAIDSKTVTALEAFQAGCELSQRPMIGVEEWMSLLLSTGYPGRTALACDCATRLDATKATQLYNAGYRYVGRYLTGDAINSNGNRKPKNLLRREMKDIFNAGLKLFLIYEDPREYMIDNQTDNIYADYFTYNRGYNDAMTAFSVCRRSLGVPIGETIFFTVDFDALESEVYQNVIPYFNGIKDYANSVGNTYIIGIYGARHVCTLVSKAGYSAKSFVAGLSTKYSGNMGYRLPTDWAFDQIQELPAGSAGLSFALDRNVASSSRSTGFNKFIDSSLDDQWDKISFTGSGKYLVNHGGIILDHQVYWAKVLDAETGTAFTPAHPIVGDFVKSNAFFSARDTASGDKFGNIRYVYYRDACGELNAGYIDISENACLNFDQGQVYRTNPPENSYMNQDSPDYSLSWYMLTRPLNYYDTGAVLRGTLPSGSKIQIGSGGLQDINPSGQSRPDFIKIAYKQLSGGATEPLIPGSDYGFVEMDFENGVMPSDRTLITTYV
jgi:peptidoglycan hydrolase-like protein with peptidoglycan-binding domain